jgi:hypothetical protein
MDQETKTAFADTRAAIEQTRAETRAAIEQTRAETRAAFANLEKLVEDTFESFGREMAAGFNRVEAATKLNSSMVVSGTLAIAGLKKWAAKRDQADKRRDAELRELRMRLTKLERRKGK